MRAITDIAAIAIPLTELRRLLRHSEGLRAAFYEELCKQIGELEQRLTELGVCSATSRVAHLLLDIYTRLEARGLAPEASFDFPVRQEDFARALGLTPVHANRVLVQLRRSGWISYERGRMHLLNVQALKRLMSEPTVTLAGACS